MNPKLRYSLKSMFTTTLQNSSNQCQALHTIDACLYNAGICMRTRRLDSYWMVQDTLMCVIKAMGGCELPWIKGI